MIQPARTGHQWRHHQSPPSALTGYLNRLLISPNPRLGRNVPVIPASARVADLPVIGWLLKMFFNQGRWRCH
jgi:hypothetical protein